MLFVTVNEEQKQLDELTALLLRVFHGSVIYQHTNPARALRDAQMHHADAVIMGECADGFAALQMLRRGCSKQTAVLVLSENKAYCAAAMQQGADGAVECPLTEQTIMDALKAVL